MGRLKHLQQGLRSFGHFPNTKISRSNEAYGFGGAEYWWDAAIGLNTSTDLGAVSFWVDRISGARWTQSTAGSQPRLRTASTINANFPAIEDQGARVMTIDTLPCFNKTIAFVHKTNSFNASGNGLLSPTGFTANGGIIYVGGTPASGVNGISVFAFSPTTSLVSGINNTNSHITVITRFGIIVDGVVAVAGTPPLFAVNMRFLFADGSGSGNFSGQLGELLIYNRNLTNAQGVELCNNLNAKWAIY